MSNCSGNCSSCSSSDCKDRDLLLKQNSFSNIKKIYAVVSGKGGVGKSSVTCQLASAMQKSGKQTAVIDADITGPSVPKMFGVKDRALAEDNLIQQFFTEVKWGDVDYMFVDMPPGTGDVALTVFQSLKVDGIIVVTTPQDLVSMIVAKAVNMAKLMNVPIVGIIENMSYFVCDECDKKHFIFGESKIESVAAAFGIPVIASLPINTVTPALADKGEIFKADLTAFDEAIKSI